MDEDLTFWFSMSEEILLEVLHRAYNGDHPDDLVAEMFASASDS